MSTLRLGVIGLGRFGRRHAAALRCLEGVELVAAVDPCGKYAPELPGLPVLCELDALLDRGIDAAIVAAPPAANPRLASRLAAEGIHVLFEKPLGCSIAAAERVRDAFVGTGLVAGVGHIERFNPVAVAMREVLHAEHGGRVRALRAHRCGPVPRRSWWLSVGLDLAVHDVDLLAWISGPLSPPQETLGDGEYLHAAGEVGAGVPFTITADRRGDARVRRLTAVCEEGTLVADLLEGTLKRGRDRYPRRVLGAGLAVTACRGRTQASARGRAA